MVNAHDNVTSSSIVYHHSWLFMNPCDLSWFIMYPILLRAARWCENALLQITYRNRLTVAYEAHRKIFVGEISLQTKQLPWNWLQLDSSSAPNSTPIAHPLDTSKYDWTWLKSMSLMSCNILQILMRCCVSVLLWCPGNHQGHDAMMQAATTTPAKTWMFIDVHCMPNVCNEMLNKSKSRNASIIASPRRMPKAQADVMAWRLRSFHSKATKKSAHSRYNDIQGTVTTAINSKPLQLLEIFSDAFKTWWQIKCMFYIFLVVWDLISAQGASQIVQVTIFPCFNGPVKKECIHPASISKCSLGWCLAFGLKFLDN